MQSCDTVFFLDYPTEVCLDGIRNRRGNPLPDMPWVETEEDAEFVEFIQSYNQQSRPCVMELLRQYPEKNVFIFQNRDEADDFLNSL